jgi:hypothetical protein
MSAEPAATRPTSGVGRFDRGRVIYLPKRLANGCGYAFTDADAERVRELSEKAHIGQLTATEERELDNYLNVGRTLEFLKAKARLSLHKNTTG